MVILVIINVALLSLIATVVAPLDVSRAVERRPFSCLFVDSRFVFNLPHRSVNASG